MNPNFNSNSTKDNTKITIINAHNNSVSSTIYNVNYNSGANDSRVQLLDNYYSSHNNQVKPMRNNNEGTKPPVIPSLKSKIFQTALAAG